LVTGLGREFSDSLGILSTTGCGDHVFGHIHQEFNLRHILNTGDGLARLDFLKVVHKPFGNDTRKGSLEIGVAQFVFGIIHRGLEGLNASLGIIHGLHLPVEIRPADGTGVFIPDPLHPCVFLFSQRQRSLCLLETPLDVAQVGLEILGIDARQKLALFNRRTLLAGNGKLQQSTAHLFEGQVHPFGGSDLAGQLKSCCSPACFHGYCLDRPDDRFRRLHCLFPTGNQKE